MQPLVLITGSAGLIGTRLAADLAADYRVVGLDVSDPPRDFAGIEHVPCDLTDDASTRAAFDHVRRAHGEHVASVVHLAAYHDFAGEPSPLYRTLTVEGTQRLCGALRRFGRVEQLVFASTLLVMRPATDEDEAITEQSELLGEWDYPQSKIAAENVIRAEHGDIPAVILRMAGAYDEDGNSPPLTQHIARIHEKRIESVLFPGDPSHGQPFVHLSDLIDCFRRVVDQRGHLGPLEIFLVAEPDLMSHAALQERIGLLVHGKRWPTIRIPAPIAKAGAWVQEKLAPAGEEPFIRPWMVDLADRHYPASIARAGERIAWAPKRRLHDVLPEMIARMQEDPIGFYEANGLPVPEELRRRESAE